ncbi:MAG: hisK [Clostridia bacterium]|nr:hisK [Clostridia bacterium]
MLLNLWVLFYNIKSIFEKCDDKKRGRINMTGAKGISGKVIRDGHIHSSYCPHGTDDPIEGYIQEALKKGIEEMTFTEHMPLPDHVVSSELQRECALELGEVPLYFSELDRMKKKYNNKVKINKGLEVDYIEGYEAQTKELLDLYGEELEDGILSVHILKVNECYRCIDMGPEEFGEIAREIGGVEKLYDLYYKTLLKAIRADLGKYKPRRIGHPTLIRIFNQKYPLVYQNEKLLEEVVKEIKEKEYQIDFNTAGIRKPFCKEVYPAGLFFELVQKYKVEIVYGSDAHTASDVGRDF